MLLVGGHFSREYGSLRIDLPLIFYCFFIVLLFCFLLPSEQNLSCRLDFSCCFEKLLGPQFYFSEVIGPCYLNLSGFFFFGGGVRNYLPEYFLNDFPPIQFFFHNQIIKCSMGTLLPYM